MLSYHSKSFWLVLLFVIAIAGLLAYFTRDLFYRLHNELFTEKLQFLSPANNALLNYRLFKPKQKTGYRYPLLLILHGGAEQGNDNIKQITNLASTFFSNKIQRKHPSFLIIPQCPKGTQWVNTGFKTTPYGHYQQSSIPESREMKMIIEVIKQLIAQYPIDTAKIYAVGFSMGASGTWDILSRHPELFAAGMIMAGVSDTSTAKTIKNIPVWAFTGELDNIAPANLNKEMCDAVVDAGGNCRFTMYKNTGHYCVDEVFKEPGVMDWLFAQHR